MASSGNDLNRSRSTGVSTPFDLRPTRPDADVGDETSTQAGGRRGGLGSATHRRPLLCRSEPNMRVKMKANGIWRVPKGSTVWDFKRWAGGGVGGAVFRKWVPTPHGSANVLRQYLLSSVPSQVRNRPSSPLNGACNRTRLQHRADKSQRATLTFARLEFQPDICVRPRRHERAGGRGKRGRGGR